MDEQGVIEIIDFYKSRTFTAEKEIKRLKNDLDFYVDKVMTSRLILDEIEEVANENMNTAQYSGICRTILDIIKKHKGERK